MDISLAYKVRFKPVFTNHLYLKYSFYQILEITGFFSGYHNNFDHICISFEYPYPELGNLPPLN